MWELPVYKWLKGPKPCIGLNDSGHGYGGGKVKNGPWGKFDGGCQGNSSPGDLGFAGGHGNSSCKEDQAFGWGRAANGNSSHSYSCSTMTEIVVGHWNRESKFVQEGKLPDSRQWKNHHEFFAKKCFVEDTKQIYSLFSN